MNNVRTGRAARGVAAVGALTCLSLVAAPLAANAAEETERWTTAVTTHDTGVNNGYQLAFDKTNGQVYFTDAKWRTETRHNGTLEGEPLDWSEVREGATSHSSMRTTFSPYGIAVDGKLDGGTIVTTTARQRDAAAGYGGGVVIYKASQGEPTDADRVFAFDDGTPIFSGVRRIAVNETTHQAFVTNLGNSRGSGSDGFIAVLDLTKRGAEAVQARVTIPDAAGGLGVAVDEANNLIYVGSMTGDKLYVIDGSKIDASNPKDLTINNGAIRALDAVVGANARPTYNAELKRVFVSAYDEKTITSVNADPASADYGKAIAQISTGATNAVEADGARGLLYSANLGDQEVVVYDAETLEQLHEVPTSGNAVNLGLNPENGEVWVSNFSNAGKTDVFKVESTTTVENPDAPVSPTAQIAAPTDANALLTYDTEWTASNKLKISGTGWSHPEGGGSVIAVKIDRGNVKPNETVDADAPDDVWALITASADGSFSAELDYPSTENSSLTEAWAADEVHKVSLLTGSMRAGDVIRGLTVDVTTKAPPAPIEVDGWSHSTSIYNTGVSNGYQLAYDDDNGKVYFADAKWRSETRNADTGEITEVSEGTGKVVEFNAASHELTANHSFLNLRRVDGARPITANEGTGKVVQFDAASQQLTANHSFLDLTRNDGTGKDSEPLDWSDVRDSATSHSSMRTTFSPYGIAVDGALDGGTIITTTARQRDAAAGFGGGIVIYPVSQGAPSDADRVFAFDDGTPVFNGVRRVAVNQTTHQAFVTNLGNSRGSGSDGFIAVLDLTKRGAEAVQARITIPDAVGAIGVDVDEANNLIYVGSMTGDKLYVIDGSKIDTSDPKSLTLNNDAVTELDAVVGANARPTYSPELKRVYSSAYDANTIAVVDADPASEGYGKLIDTIETGPTNAVAVDGELGLVYSANLGDQQVVAFDTEEHEQQFAVPTSGNAVNLGIDPTTRNVWVSNFSNAGKTDVISVTDNAPPVDGGGDNGGNNGGTDGNGGGNGSGNNGGGNTETGNTGNTGDKLERTGAEPLAPLAIGAVVALALGAALLLLKRRRAAE